MNKGEIVSMALEREEYYSELIRRFNNGWTGDRNNEDYFRQMAAVKRRISLERARFAKWVRDQNDTGGKQEDDIKTER